MATCSSTILEGMTQDQLRAALTAAQTAYTELVTGAKVVSVAYTQADSSRSVQFSKTTTQDLVQFIQLLQLKLGLTRGRRPVRFNF